jgi:signal transduction histidine kinase
MNKNVVKIIFISTAVILAYSYLTSPLSNFHRARLLSMDVITRIIYNFSKTPKEANNIVIVSIDRESLSNINQTWPWNRNLFAECINKLKEYDPRLMYLDFSFIGESDDKSQDDNLASALKNASNVIIPFYFDEKGKPLFPLEKLIESSFGFGPVNKLRDIDLSVRDAPLLYFSPSGELIDYSLELILLCKYYGISLGDISLNKRYITLNIPDNKGKIPITKDGMLHINYMLRQKDIPTVPFWKVLHKQLPQETFKNKLVIIGITDKSFIDAHKTPLGMLSGSEIIANIVTTVLSKKYIYFSSNDINVPFLLPFMILITLTVFFMPAWKGFFLTLFEIFTYLALSIFLSKIGVKIEVFSICLLGIIVYITTKIFKFICLLEEQNMHLQKALIDLKEAEAGLIESEKLAAIGRFSAQISHEINNPLSTVYNSVSTIKYIAANKGELEKIKEISERVINELNRLMKLGREILSSARPLPKDELKPADINKILTDTAAFYKDLFERAGQKIQLNTNDSLPLTKTSIDKMKQVFSNIIINAQDAMGKDGILTISTDKFDDNCIKIVFSDNGSGIPQDILKKIFDPFFTTKKLGKGTGLGLFTVQTILKNYNGKIDVESKLNKGTTFTIQLPIK